MSTSEAERLELHLKLQDVLGEHMAEVLMEHLPPNGWGDVARKSDVDHLATIMDIKFNAIDSRLNGLVAGLWAVGTVTVTTSIGLFTLIATKL